MRSSAAKDRAPALPGPAADLPEMRLMFAAEPYAVRATLEGLMGFLRPRGLDEDSQGRVEIVLAEVLNNVCEHAFARVPGRVELRLRAEGEHLAFVVIDDGEPMPGRRLPVAPTDPARFVELMPEGGFGWFLIRSEAEALSYRRDRGRNRLSFRLRVALA